MAGREDEIETNEVPNQTQIENTNNLELVLRDNICNAALMKVMQNANSLADWKVPVLPWGSLNNLIYVFERPESSITRVECSVERGYLPTTEPDILVSMMMDQDQWLNGPMSQIIKSGSSKKVNQGADLSIQELQRVNAEFWLPTPLVETRRSRFMRFFKVLPCPGVMAIIDVSDDFLTHKLQPLDPNEGPQCRRLPSGLLIRKKKFLSYVHQASRDGLKALTSGHPETCVLVHSLSLETEPWRGLLILSQKILQLQGMKIFEELCRFTDSQNTNCIAVYWVQNEQDRSNAYIVQEVSTDAYCSFVISVPITKEEYDDAQLPRYPDLRPSGLVITPGGAAGIKSDTSLVTYALQVDVNPDDPEPVQDDRLAQRSIAIEKQIHALVR